MKYRAIVTLPCRAVVKHTTISGRPRPCGVDGRLLSSAVRKKKPAVSKKISKFDQRKEEHELRVAEAQARVRVRRQGQNNVPVQQPAAKSVPNNNHIVEQKQRIFDRNTILISVQHWLQKDEAFFAATMEGLELKLLQWSDGNNNSGLARTQQQIDDDNDEAIGKGAGRRRRQSGSASTLVTPPRPIQRHHPMQAMWDQYRQLYFDSIPGFREHLESNHDVLSNSLQALQQVGFDDPQWSRSFRQVRGYRLQQDGMMRHEAKQRRELQQRQEVLTKAQLHLKDLEEMDRLISKVGSDTAKRNRYREDNNDGSDRSIRGLQRKSKSKSMHHNEAAPDRASQSRNEEHVSFVQSAWAQIKSFFVSPSIANSAEIESRTSSAEKELPNDDSSGNVPEEVSRAASPRPTQLQKRIKRKKKALQELQDDYDEVQRKLEIVRTTKDSYKPPIPDTEYERAYTVVSTVRDDICSEFARHIQGRHTQLIEQYQTLDSKTDLTKPQEWYPYARMDKRKIIFHGGPTNSGKTFSALQRLKEANRGLYLGPLRLLAAEVYETLTAEGIYTNLFTGQERREIAFSTHSAATVEMASTRDEYDVVVLDEIQMICDESRGAAWTKALLSLRCKEIHVCGGLEAKDIVQKIARACGDEFELHQYQRFTELQVSRKALAHDSTRKGAYVNVQPGDCVVAFSRNDIFAIKREIESTTGHKCCVIYGKLPPQTRADQARRFNDPDSGYDVLVASDAIGMGLNLNIKRIIFNSIFKFNGDKIIRLSHSEVKQIAGRAGRRNSPFPEGEVTCRDPRDLAYISECLATEIKPIERAALLPTSAHIEVFSEAIRAYNVDNDSHSDLHQILRQFSAMATVKGDFFLGRQTEMRMIAKHLKNIPIPLRDAYTMCLSPTSENSLDLLESCARKLSRGEVFGLPSRSVPHKAKSFDDLSYLCGIYADSDLFLWLQFKFPPGNAVEQAAALGRKDKTMEFINLALASTESLKLNHCYLKQAKRLRSSWEAENGPSQDVGIVVADHGNDAEYDDDADDDSEDDDVFYVDKRHAM